MDYYTYIYKDPTRNNEPIYVGKGKGNRCYDHLNSRKNAPLPNRIKKIKEWGYEPIIEFLCKDVDEELAFFVEEEAISLYGRKDLGTGTLLNLTDGGDGISNVSDETRKKLSEANKRRPPASAETRSKLSQAAKGIPKSKTHVENVRKALIGTKKDASAKLKMSKSKITAGILPPSHKGKMRPKASCIHCKVEMSVINLKGRHWLKCNAK